MSRFAQLQRDLFVAGTGLVARGGLRRQKLEAQPSGDVSQPTPPPNPKSGTPVGQRVAQLLSPMLAKLELDGPAPDSELPEALRGKGLVRGKPVALFPVGRAEARDGRLFIVDEESIASLIADGNTQDSVSFTYEHEDDPVHGGDNSGYMLHFAVANGFVVADRIYWTAVAAEKIATGARGYVSPDVYCDPLDPRTNELLPYGSETNTFRPMQWRAASLVGVPALKNLPPASLAAGKTVPPASAKGKETPMDPKLLKLLKLSASATDEEKTKALAAAKSRLKLSADASDAEVMKTLEAEVMAADTVKCEACGAEMPKDSKFCSACGAKMGAAAPTAPASAPPDPSEEMTKGLAAMEKRFEEKQAKANAEAADKIRQEMAAREKAEKIDAELLKAEQEGRLVAADREFWQAAYVKDEGKARLALAALPRVGPGGERWYEGAAHIEGGSFDESLSVDRKPERERNEILSRAAAWHKLTAKPFEHALEDVLKKDPEEAKHHSRVLASNPDWGKPANELTGRRGEKWAPKLNAGPSASPEWTCRTVDEDKLRFALRAIQEKNLPTVLSPERLAALKSQKLGGEASNFQPGARFGVAGFGFGIFQGKFAGSQIAQEYQGGANEQAYYPVMGSEAIVVEVNAAGVPEPVGRNAEDKDASTWGVDFRLVNMHGYGNVVWVDRRDQSAGDAVLPIGVMATAAKQALTKEQTKKELIQAATLRDTSKYATGFTKDLNTGTRQWDDPASTPIQDFKGARMKIWRATGADIDSIVSLMGLDVVETLSFHPDLVKAAQVAGFGHMDKSMASVPVEFLLATFGTIYIPTCRVATSRSGSNADSPWGQDVILAAISKEPIAPRAFATITSGGYPLVRTLTDERRGLKGSDGADLADMYAVEVAGPSSGTTNAAYLFQNAVPQLDVAA